MLDYFNANNLVLLEYIFKKEGFFGGYTEGALFIVDKSKLNTNFTETLCYHNGEMEVYTLFNVLEKELILVDNEKTYDKIEFNTRLVLAINFYKEIINGYQAYYEEFDEILIPDPRTEDEVFIFG